VLVIRKAVPDVSNGAAQWTPGSTPKTSYLDGANPNRDVDLDVTLGSAEADKTLGH